MKVKNVILGVATYLLLINNLSAQSCDNGHRGHRGGGHNHHGNHTSDNSMINKTYLVHYTDQDYKLIFLNDSTIKLNNDKTYPLTKIRRGIYLASWPDKNTNMLSNVIDWQAMKIYSTNITSDKKATVLTASISEEQAVTTPAIKEEKATEPLKKN